MQEFDLKEKMIHRLLLESPFVKDIGLWRGKMGIALFFFHQGRASGCEVCTEAAQELLEEVWNQVHAELPFHFDSGLSGIGWGVEYLLQNRFIEGDGNEICEEIDRKIMEIHIRRLQDPTLEKGSAGLYYYLSARIRGALSQHRAWPFDREYLDDLSRANPVFAPARWQEFCARYPLSPAAWLNRAPIDETSYLSAPLGLRSGLAGYMLTQTDCL